MSGRGSTWHENALVPITRNGRREDVYWTYGYQPIDDPLSPTGVGGVLVVCTEATEAVLARRRLAFEREQFAQLFEQAPAFMAMLRGSDHRFELANPAYRRLVSERDVIGKTVAEALPEAGGSGLPGAAGQGLSDR
jgi:PAS domain-containing protein